MCPDVATPCVKDKRRDYNGMGTICAQLTAVGNTGTRVLSYSVQIGHYHLHVCCESCHAVARQVVGRHADARMQGFTVHPCAVTVMDKHAATFML